MSLCGEQLEQSADIQGICEHNQDTHQYNLRQHFKRSAQIVFGPQHVVELGSSDFRSITAYKPGGTGLLAYGPIIGRIYARGSDKYGRWSYFHLQAAQSQTITVLQIYQVCSRPTNQKGITAYHQQEAAYSIELRPDTRPCKNFRQDLSRLISDLKQQNHHLIVMGDFNECIHTNGSTVQALSQDHNLVDIWARRFPHSPEPATHIRGSQRIDYILISPILIPAVQAVGYEPFHENLTTDHRGLFIDFDTTALFGSTHLPLAPARSRAVNSKHAARRETYIRASSDHGYKNMMFSRLDALLTSGHRDDPLIEKLDTLLGQCCALGEAKCTKIRTSWYTKRMARLRVTRRILQKLISHFRNYPTINLLPSLTLQHEANGSVHPLPTTLSDTYTALKHIKKEIRQELRECRQNRLQEQAEQIAAERGSASPDHAKILEQISQTKQKNAMWGMFRTIRGKHVKQGLTRLQIPESWPPPTNTPVSASEWEDAKGWASAQKPFRTLTLPAEIEYYLLARNRSHFGKASGTPFTIPPLSDELPLDDITQLLLSYCRRVSPPDAIPPQITLPEFEAKLRTWKESTSTSPSGRHLGHYKTLLKPIGFRGNTDFDAHMLESARTDLLKAHLGIINYCLRHGYSLKRWHNIVNVMILKEPGNVRIHRLRVIHLYEADYNLILSLKWRALQKHADRSNTLNDGQYGSRAGRESTALPLFEELRTDIALCSRKPLLNFDNDADSCYDRIVVAMSSLLSRKYGMHRHVVCVNVSTLLQARYTLKTSLGISVDSYSHCAEFPIYGSGQGSGNSPVLWCFISSTLFDCHQSKAYGALFESPDRQSTLTFSMVGFVDDSTGTVNEFDTPVVPTIESLVHKMQSDAQLWSDLLWCSGGKLELPKCSYHFLYFDFQPDGTPMPRDGPIAPLITVTSPDGTPIPIPAKSAYAPHKTLGHYKAPAGNARTQLQVLEAKQLKISQYLSSSPATRTEASTYYHSIYLPSIHVLPQSSFTNKELDQAESKSMPSIFAKCGYNRTTRRTLLYGPAHYLGGGFIRWKWLQGEGQILQFLKYWRTTDRVGLVLRIAVAWLQYHAGVHFSILEYPTRKTPPLAGRWLPALRRFLVSIDGSLELDKSYIPPIQRVGDRHIMSVAIDSETFTDDELNIINHCRLYLNVITISDLVDATGRSMIPGVRWGDLDAFPFTPKGHIPHQASPALLYWIYWQRLLNLLFDESQHLLISLGPWLHPGSILRNTWNAYYDYRYKFLYRRTPQGFYQYELFDQHFIAGILTSWTPNDYCVPVAVSESSVDCWYLDSPPQLPPSTPPATIPITFSEYLALLPQTEQTLFADLHLCYSVFEIAAKITLSPPLDAPSPADYQSRSCHSEFLLVSDGSAASQVMTFGWTLCLPDGDRLVYCSGPAFGSGSSHRAEATGMLSGVRFLYHLSHYTGLSIQAPFLIKTDNQGLVTRTTQCLSYDTCYPSSTLAANWDLVEEIHQTLRALPHTPSIQHVHGHQDRTVRYHHLPLDAQLNVDADTEANNYHIMYHPTSQLRVPLLPTTRVHLHIRGTTITSHYTAAIRAAASEPEYFQALQSRNHWSSNTFQTLDLPSLKQASRNSILPQPFLFKLVHQCLPTQTQKSKWDNGPDICPFCHSTDDQTHFIRCSNLTLAKWRQQFIQQFRARCDSLHTSFELQSVFVDALHALFKSRTIRATDYPAHLHDAILSQHRLGWQSFFRGYWTAHWRCLQQAHLIRHHITDPKLSSNLWASTLISFTWQATHFAWEHHNQYIHRTGQNRLDSDLRTRTIQRVRALHLRRPDVLLLHQNAYFLPDLEHALANHSTASLRNWVQLYEPAIHASIRLKSTIATQHVPQLTTFFPVLHPSKRQPKPRYSTRFNARFDAPSKSKRRKPTSGCPRII